MRSLWMLAFLCLTLPGATRAETCETNCNDQCRVNVGIGNFVEPSCRVKCESAKALACRGVPVPTIPATPFEPFDPGLTATCSSLFQTITSAVIAQCSNWGDRLDDQHLIVNARNLLQSSGIIDSAELERVQVRWCPLNGAHGMAPEIRRIYLDVGLKRNPFATAKTLAHEVVHLRQYHREGAENFKCNYSRQYVECGGCQDRRNRFEREAYDFEAQIEARLTRALNSVPIVADGRGTRTSDPRPVLGFPTHFVMQNCGCWGFNGINTAPEPRCQSGTVVVAPCQGMCQMGGAPFAYVCQ